MRRRYGSGQEPMVSKGYEPVAVGPVVGQEAGTGQVVTEAGTALALWSTRC
jgi:hypothetical protein